MEYIGYAYFVERPRRLEDLIVPHPVEAERPYRVAAEIRLSAMDYENFVTDLLADRLFLSDHGGRCGRGEVWTCLLVRSEGKEDGVLIMPKAGCFVGWAAANKKTDSPERLSVVCSN